MEQEEKSELWGKSVEKHFYNPRYFTLNNKCQPHGTKVKSCGTTKVSEIHPLETMDISTTLHGHPTSKCRDISAWT